MLGRDLYQSELHLIPFHPVRSVFNKQTEGPSWSASKNAGHHASFSLERLTERHADDGPGT